MDDERKTRIKPSQLISIATTEASDLKITDGENKSKINTADGCRETVASTYKQGTKVINEKIPGREKNVTQADRWEEMFNRLLAFREKNGHCHVPTHYDEDPKLGKWVAAQRQQYKTSGHGITPRWVERESRLKEIDFEWTAKNPRCVSWETRFKQLLEFVVQNGHAQVPIGWEENVQLANWVSAQRQDFQAVQMGRASSRLNRERIDLLNSIGFVWKAQRGGLKRPRQGNQVPVPLSYGTTTISSDFYQTRARNLLEAMDNISSSQLKDTETTQQNASPAQIGELGQQEFSCGFENERKKRAKSTVESKDMCHPRVEISTNPGTIPFLSGLNTAPTRNQPRQLSIIQENNYASERNNAHSENINRILQSLVPLPTVHPQLQVSPLQALLTETTYQPISFPLSYIPLSRAVVPTTSQHVQRQHVEIPPHLLLNNRHMLTSHMPQLASVSIDPLSLASQILLTWPTSALNGQQSVGASNFPLSVTRSEHSQGQNSQSRK